MPTVATAPTHAHRGILHQNRTLRFHCQTATRLDEEHRGGFRRQPKSLQVAAAEAESIRNAEVEPGRISKVEPDRNVQLKLDRIGVLDPDRRIEASLIRRRRRSLSGQKRYVDGLGRFLGVDAEDFDPLVGVDRRRNFEIGVVGKIHQSLAVGVAVPVEIRFTAGTHLRTSL